MRLRKTMRRAAPVSPAPIRSIRGTLIRLEVERLPRPTKAPTPLWFWWAGPRLRFGGVWRASIARFALEHTFRFFKQTWRWTTPKLRSPPLPIAGRGCYSGLCPAPFGARCPCRRAPTVAATAAARASHARTRSPGFWQLLIFGQPRACQNPAGARQGVPRQALPARPALPGGQIDAVLASTPALRPYLAITWVVGRFLWVKMQA